MIDWAVFLALFIFGAIIALWELIAKMQTITINKIDLLLLLWSDDVNFFGVFLTLVYFWRVICSNFRDLNGKCVYSNE